MRLIPSIVLFFIPFLLTAPSYAWTVEKIASLNGVPWGLSSVDSQYLLITERKGKISLLDLKSKLVKPLFSPPDVVAMGQGGLLDVAKSPFEDNAFYFTFSTASKNAIETALAKAYLKDQQLVNWQVLFTSHSGSNGGRHFGSRITFDEQSLYLSIGDRGERDNGQDLSTHAGSILRLTPDGQPAVDNPFISDKQIQDEIWSYGHRNPQGLFYDALSKHLWSIEHGPRGGDEINLIKRKANYGWPITSHGKEYWGPLAVGEGLEKEGIESPHKVYIPSIAPGSIVLYRGNLHPSLNGKLLAGALKLTHINILTLEGEEIIAEQRVLEHLGERIRDIELGPKGEIYFSTDSGNIYHLINTKS